MMDVGMQTLLMLYALAATMLVLYTDDRRRMGQQHIAFLERRLKQEEERSDMHFKVLLEVTKREADE